MDAFFNLLSTLPKGLVYFLLAVSAFVENVFPPIPGDTITAFGAFLVGTQHLSFWGVYLSTTLGSLCGFLALFWMGSLLGRTFFLKRDYRFFKASDILRAEAWFQKYGYTLILLNRFFPGIRSVISIAGGISGLKIHRVAILACISAAVWNLLWIYAGYTLGANWELVREKMENLLFRYNLVVFCLFGVVAGFFILRMILKRIRK